MNDGQLVSQIMLGNSIELSNFDNFSNIGLFNLPERNGKLKLSAIEKFDNEFFGMEDKLIAHLDPQERLFMELIYETLIDAGK